MLVLQVRLSFANLDREKSSVLNFSESCHSKRQLYSAMAGILSAWRGRIRLEVSRHRQTSFGS